MADNKVNEATWNMLNSLRETNKAIADSTVAVQERNTAFAQSILENGIEVLKSHAECTRALTHELTEQAQKQSGLQEGFQTVVDSTAAIQERNTKFAQSVFENGIEVLKSQVGVTRTLMQELEQQAQKQQNAFQALAHESLDTYISFLRAPFSYYQQAFEATEKATRAGLENIQNATRHAQDAVEHATN